MWCVELGGWWVNFGVVRAILSGHRANFDGVRANLNGCRANFAGVRANFDGVRANFTGLCSKLSVSVWILRNEKHQQSDLLFVGVFKPLL